MKHILLLALSCLLVSCGQSAIHGSSADWTIAPVYTNLDSTKIDGYEITHYTGEHFDGTLPTTVDGKKIVSIANPARGRGMFTNAKDTTLTRIDLSHAKYLKRVGESTFAGCKHVTELIMNEDLESVTDGAFAECKSLSTIVWSKELKTIGEAAFYSCASLQDIVIPNTVDTLGAYGFYACRDIETVQFSKQLVYIGMRAFGNCAKIKYLDFPKTLTYIGEKAFLNSKTITELTIPAKVTAIGEKAFFQSKALTKLTLKNTLGTKIAKQTFYSTPVADSSDASIYYPKSANYPAMENWNTFKGRWLAQ